MSGGSIWGACVGSVNGLRALASCVGTAGLDPAHKAETWAQDPTPGLEQRTQHMEPAHEANIRTQHKNSQPGPITET